MKRIVITFLIVCFVSCSNSDDFRKTNGTKLVKIDFKDSNRTIDQWNEQYSYTDNGALDKVEDFYSLGTRYLMEYQNNQLREYSIYRIDNEELIGRDSISYYSNGTIKAIYKFSINSGNDIPLNRILEFKYDNQIRVSEKKTYFVAIEEYTSIEKIYWGNKNIERVEYYNGKGKLYYEYFYTYDDKSNYKKGMPIHISNPINWSENNVVEMDWKDYLGNLDLICRPCTAAYKYNLDGFPVSITYNWGRKLTLSYELESTSE